mmetsp:Transcript_30547/g.65811  ORF Transcript_30547/g.65811 Transcript_30547/m.65811 type:complete len:298 (+) Transcript_30547:160-1053(+)
MVSEAERQKQWINRMKEEETAAKDNVKKQFEVWDRNNLAQQMLHESGGAADRIYGGEMSSRPSELQLVKAWRPDKEGTWMLDLGVIHRVHEEEDAVTVQFFSDQHRCQLPTMNVQPQLNITPSYPTIRLAPGNRLPTASELEAREHNRELRRKELGLNPCDPLPDEDLEGDLLAGEHRDVKGNVIVYSDTWGIPAPTLTALRNRCIPRHEVKEYYDRHFYSKLYENNFYQQQPGWAVKSLDFTPPPAHDPVKRKKKVVQHTYIPISGPPMIQNLETGEWRASHDVSKFFGDGPGLLG